MKYFHMSSCHFISRTCCFPLASAMEVPSRQAHCGSQHSAQLVTGAETDFLGNKRETDTKDSNYRPWTEKKLSRPGNSLQL